MSYISMAEILQPCKVGSAEIQIFTVDEKASSYTFFRSYVPAGKYARLKINGHVIMSDTPMEWRTNRECIYYAHGDVLIGGLGIGMIIMAIQDNESVKSITVVEKNPDVIAAVKDQLPLNGKVRIIEGDVYTYVPDRKYDCVYMDIWGDISEDTYTDMVKLKRKYGHFLKPLSESPKRFNKCWAEYNAKNGVPF